MVATSGCFTLQARESIAFYDPLNSNIQDATLYDCYTDAFYDVLNMVYNAGTTRFFYTSDFAIEFSLCKVQICHNALSYLFDLTLDTTPSISIYNKIVNLDVVDSTSGALQLSISYRNYGHGGTTTTLTFLNPTQESGSC